MMFRSHVVVTAGVAVILGLLLTASPAVAACDPDNAVFEDDFEFLDPSWGAPADNFFVEDGVLVLKGFWGQTNGLTRNEGADVCVDMTIVEAPAPENSPIGLVWWWESWDNYYYLFYWPIRTLWRSGGGSRAPKKPSSPWKPLLSRRVLAKPTK